MCHYPQDLWVTVGSLTLGVSLVYQTLYFGVYNLHHFQSGLLFVFLCPSVFFWIQIVLCHSFINLLL
jgi:hypothetical protein